MLPIHLVQYIPSNKLAPHFEFQTPLWDPATDVWKPTLKFQLSGGNGRIEFPVYNFTKRKYFNVWV